MNTILINEKEYKYKYTLRALFIFEKITGRPFSLEGTIDTFTFFFSMLLACNKDCDLTFDQFIDACDQDETIANTMGDYLVRYFQHPLNQQAEEAKDDDKVAKKK